MLRIIGFLQLDDQLVRANIDAQHLGRMAGLLENLFEPGLRPTLVKEAVVSRESDR